MYKNERFVQAIASRSPEVREGLARMVRWYKQGMPPDIEFSKYSRLCINMFFETGIEYALEELFSAYGLFSNPFYPFEGGQRIDDPEDIYKNPLRVQFLLDAGEVLKEKGYDC